MPYWVTKNGSSVRSFVNRLDAIDWIESQERALVEQGFAVPEYKIWFCAQEVSRHYGCNLEVGKETE